MSLSEEIMSLSEERIMSLGKEDALRAYRIMKTIRNMSITLRHFGE